MKRLYEPSHHPLVSEPSRLVREMARPAKHIPPSPPDKGSFPLDHFRECSDAKSIYMDCLKQHDMQAEDCRHLAAAYLQCRMDACARRPHYLHARSPRSARART